MGGIWLRANNKRQIIRQTDASLKDWKASCIGYGEWQEMVCGMEETSYEYSKTIGCKEWDSTYCKSEI